MDLRKSFRSSDMTSPVALEETTANAHRRAALAAGSLTVNPLADGDEGEALAFLAVRPIHTVIMAGFIRDNGLVSSLNRGIFYACRDAEGRLEGVAHIGHATLVEARSEAALEAFARLAQAYPCAHLIMGEQEKVERFWSYYAESGQALRRFCRELLFEQRQPVEVREVVQGLRLGTLDDLVHVIPVQAQMAFEESGINPLETDAVGFRERCARRIDQGRVWVLMKSGQLIFKADIISDTPEVVYLEGVYVNPEARGKAYGLNCLSQLSRNLLARAGSICLFVNERNLGAQAFYRCAGYKLQSYYDTVFLHRKSEAESINDV
jgi:ribosomal protein S18 acetylase RimI-like enzyme